MIIINTVASSLVPSFSMRYTLKSNVKKWEWAGDEAKDTVNYYSQTFCSCVSYTTSLEGEVR